jgi:pilus assembly protein Flp/PilA
LEGGKIWDFCKMRKLVLRFIKDESGATAIEYGLIAALVAVAIIGGARLLGTRIGGTFNNVSNAIK